MIVGLSLSSDHGSGLTSLYSLSFVRETLNSECNTVEPSDMQGLPSVR